PTRVLEARLGIVDRARADDDENPVVRTVKQAVNRLPRVIDQLLGFFRAGKFAQQECGRRELLDLPDSDVVDLEVHACRLGRVFSKKLKSLNFTRLNPRRNAAPSASGAATRTENIAFEGFSDCQKNHALGSRGARVPETAVNAAKPRSVRDVRRIVGDTLA